MDLEILFFFVLFCIICWLFLSYHSQKIEAEKWQKRCNENASNLSEKVKKNTELEKKLSSAYSEIDLLHKQIQELNKKIESFESDFQTLTSSNLTAIPWLAGMMGDFLTSKFEVAARSLDWGFDQKRLKKVASLREIRAEAARITAQGKEAIYQLEYLRSLFPNIDDYLEADYKDIYIPDDIFDVDPVRGYLSKEEWDTLSNTEKNQLALDRYIKAHKSKWQIGRDYELAVAYEYEQHGYEVDRFGSYMQLEDHGRDLIAKRNGKIQIIQCKYWSNTKTIHEKHLFQLFGSVISYCVENNVSPENVKGVFVTNIKLSPFAEKVAKHLNLHVSQNHPFREFPRIKCNVGKNEWGGKTYIYHLPMDAQYDRVKICNKGEFYAFTVKEAEDAGFRRTYKWHGNS